MKWLPFIPEVTDLEAPPGVRPGIQDADTAVDASSGGCKVHGPGNACAVGSPKQVALTDLGRAHDREREPTR